MTYPFAKPLLYAIPRRDMGVDVFAHLGCFAKKPSLKRVKKRTDR